MSARPSFIRRRWPAILLAVSLVLNGFFIGMMVADWLKPHRGFSGERVATFELRRFDERLPEEAVETIAAGLRPLAPQLQEHVDRLREIRREMMNLAAVPDPDRAAIDERLAALRTEAAAMQEAVQEATYDALLKLPADERAGLAEARR